MLTLEIIRLIVTDISSINSDSHKSKFMKEIVELINQYLNIYLVGIFLLDKKQQVAIFKAGTGKLGEFLLSHNHQIPLNPPSDLVEGVLLNEIRIVNGWSQKVFKYSLPTQIETHTISDLDLHKDYTDDAESISKTSVQLPVSKWEVFFPLRTQKEIFGGLYMQMTDANQFDMDEVIKYQILADQISPFLLDMFA